MKKKSRVAFHRLHHSFLSAMKIAVLYHVYVIAVLFAAAGATAALRLSKEDGRGCFSAIYNFGDSMADTGNALLSRPGSSTGRLPYGETFFGRPTGRYSDGRLIIDFIAEACGMSFLDPYLDASSPHRDGINFAVGGATALNASYFYSRNLTVATEFSLQVQINWFLSHKSQLCASNPDCARHFEQALFVVGEIGGNDYTAQFWADKLVPMEEVELSVDDVVAEIEQALKKLIDDGSARRIVVPNNWPFGCWPCYLASHLHETEPRDAMGCMPTFNTFARFGNNRLQQMLGRLQAQYSGLGVKIVVADYYAAAMRVLSSPQDFGIQETMRACCGYVGSAYRFSPSAMCGVSESASVCEDPGRYFNWDGVHLTEAGYAAKASLLLDSFSNFSSPSLFKTLCNFSGMSLM